MSLRRGVKAKAEKESTMIDNLSEEDVRNLALALFHGEIFTDRHCKTPDEVLSVFAVLALADEALLKDIGEDKPGMVYEYLEKACPLSVNGLPVFLSCNFLSQDDTRQVHSLLRRLSQAEERILFEAE